MPTESISQICDWNINIVRNARSPKRGKNELPCTSQEAFEAHAPLGAERGQDGSPGGQSLEGREGTGEGRRRGRGRLRPLSRAGRAQPGRAQVGGASEISKCLTI